MSRSTMEFMGTPSRVFHWIPGEIILVVRLPRIPLEDALEVAIEQVRLQCNQFLAQYQLTLEAYGTGGRWLEPSMAPVRRRAFMFGLHRKQPLVAIFFHVRQSGAETQDAAPLALSYIQAHLEYFSQLGVSIVSAMPNWLVTAAATGSSYYSSGGPAVPPVSTPVYDGAPAGPPNSLPGWHIKFTEPNFAPDSRGAGDVVVAVLDTAQHADRIRSAASRPELRRNWLLQRLADDIRLADDSFVVDYDRYPLSNEVSTGRDESGRSRYYYMPDHGLSVAGIIRDTTPRVHIRLVRVLNDFGGGDLYALFAALTDLEREVISGSIRKLVINLSLTIMPDIRRLPSVWLEQRQWTTNQLTGIARVLHHIEEGLRLLFESLAAHGVLVVAAAGNDSIVARQQGLPPRPPRAPARYDSTLSVTSVNSKLDASIFANAANYAPVDCGVATLGGDLLEARDEYGLPDAIRGVYISPTFPTGEENASGWADWRGTSMSTAIISSLGAHLMAQGWSAGNIMMRLAATRHSEQSKEDELVGSVPDAQDLLAPIIRVQQRFGL